MHLMCSPRCPTNIFTPLHFRFLFCFSPTTFYFDSPRVVLQWRQGTSPLVGRGEGERIVYLQKKQRSCYHWSRKTSTHIGNPRPLQKHKMFLLSGTEVCKVTDGHIANFQNAYLRQTDDYSGQSENLFSSFNLQNLTCTKTVTLTDLWKWMQKFWSHTNILPNGFEPPDSIVHRQSRRVPDSQWKTSNTSEDVISRDINVQLVCFICTRNPSWWRTGTSSCLYYSLLGLGSGDEHPQGQSARMSQPLSACLFAYGIAMFSTTRGSCLHL